MVSHDDFILCRPLPSLSASSAGEWSNVVRENDRSILSCGNREFFSFFEIISINMVVCGRILP